MSGIAWITCERDLPVLRMKCVWGCTSLLERGREEINYTVPLLAQTAREITPIEHSHSSPPGPPHPIFSPPTMPAHPYPQPTSTPHQALSHTPDLIGFCCWHLIYGLRILTHLYTLAYKLWNAICEREKIILPLPEHTRYGWTSGRRRSTVNTDKFPFQKKENVPVYGINWKWRPLNC